MHKKFQFYLIIWTGVLIILLMCIFPPYVQRDNNKFKGYHLIWNPPTERIRKVDLDNILADPWHELIFDIDALRLVIQIGSVIVLFSAIMFTLEQRKGSNVSRQIKEERFRSALGTRLKTPRTNS